MMNDGLGKATRDSHLKHFSLVRNKPLFFLNKLWMDINIIISTDD